MSQNNSNWEDETSQIATLNPPDVQSQKDHSENPEDFNFQQQPTRGYEQKFIPTSPPNGNGSNGLISKWGNLSLKWKQVVLFLVSGLVPLLLVMMVINQSFKEVKNINASNIQNLAKGIADKIDRNLFERYGDVQAFGLNTVVHNRKNWYQPKGSIVSVMNDYVDTYDLYYLTLLVDLDGKVIAVNSKDQNGNAISTASLYSKNYKNAQWFQDTLENKFYTSQKGNIGGSGKLTGTVITPLHINEEIKKVYPGDDGLTIGFAAPVYDSEGRVFAIWNNFAQFSFIEDIFISEFNSLKSKGFGNAEFTLLDKEGRVIIDYDPAYGQGTDSIAKRDFNVLFKLNLVEKGVSAAVKAVKEKKSGFEYAVHAKKKSARPRALRI